MMALMWAIISSAHLPVFDVNTELKELEPTHIDEILLHHLGKTAEIIIFLLGAMTIVEIIDYFNGFYTIKNFIKTEAKRAYYGFLEFWRLYFQPL
jgi:Na+/H+ antiporter NhaD/arsenite permease-like protein